MIAQLVVSKCCRFVTAFVEKELQHIYRLYLKMWKEHHLFVHCILPLTRWFCTSSSNNHLELEEKICLALSKRQNY